MYKGNVMFVDHTSSLPVRASSKCFSGDALTYVQIVAKVFRVLRDDHERNEDFEKVNSYQEVYAISYQ